MKIEIWSDYVCPFCYIGKKQLTEALEKFEHKNEVKIEFKSYELRPEIEINPGKSMAEMLAARQGVTEEEASQRLASIAARAEAEGLSFNFTDMIPTNTINAHRLTKFAEEKGKDLEVAEALLAAYFTDAKHIGEIDSLVDIAASTGLDRDEVAQVLSDDEKYLSEVHADISQAKELGIKGVPFFRINEKHNIAGSQSVDKFLEYLEEFWQKEVGSDTVITGDGCVDDNCAIPQRK